MVEAAALDAAAKRLLDDPDAVPPGLSQEAAAGWRAGRAAAVLDLLTQAERIAPPPPRPAPLFCRSRPVPAREDDGPWTAWGTLDWSPDSAETPSG